jgi:hypothetical protein
MCTGRFLQFLASILLALIVVVPVAAAPDNPNAPVEYYDDSFEDPRECTFPVKTEVSGKAKLIFLPGGQRILTTSPKLKTTLTNLADPTKQATVSITGAWHISITADGGLYYKVTGRNLLWDPIAGYVITSGNFSFAFDGEGNLSQPLQGTGHVTDVCELLS